MTYLKTEGHKKCSEFVRYAADKISDIKWKDTRYWMHDYWMLEYWSIGVME
jgi:hypothetical protein